MWQIIVIMLVTFGAELDAIEITHNDGKRLQFESQAICYAHVEANLEKLKSYASSQFDGAPVKSIICVKTPFGINYV
tara:strand:- start:149 stop:379 length:231 start_codon:yes stop_codon:yes gene_type:complete